MKGDFTEILVFLVVFLFLFFALFLLTYNKGNRTVKYLLGTFFLSLGLSISDIFLNVSGTYASYPHLAFILNPLVLIYGPLCLLLTKTLTGSKIVLIKEFKHFLPLLAIVVILIFTYHSQNLAFKKEFISRSSDTKAISTLLSSLVFFFYTGLYLFFSFNILNKYRKGLREKVSDLSNLKLDWLGYILWWFLAIIVGSLILQVISISMGNSAFLNFMMTLLLFASLVFIMSSIFKGLKSDVSFNDEFNDILEPVSIREYDPEKLNNLKDLMKDEALFLDSSLTLKKLAGRLNESPRLVSALINNGTNQSFFDFVNTYRINHFKTIVQASDDKQITILEVMYASGFNSKSSFNTAFKKINGVTPSQWKKSLSV